METPQHPIRYIARWTVTGLLAGLVVSGVVWGVFVWFDNSATGLSIYYSQAVHELPGLGKVEDLDPQLIVELGRPGVRKLVIRIALLAIVAFLSIVSAPWGGTPSGPALIGQPPPPPPGQQPFWVRALATTLAIVAGLVPIFAVIALTGGPE